MGVGVGRDVLRGQACGLFVRPRLGEAESDTEIVDRVMSDHVMPLRPGLVEDLAQKAEDIVLVR
jgi:hypothetical protein